MTASASVAETMTAARRTATTTSTTVTTWLRLHGILTRVSLRAGLGTAGPRATIPMGEATTETVSRPGGARAPSASVPFALDRDQVLTSPARLSEEQREMRSVFVSQLSARVTDRELAIFFDQQAGKVREARVIVDRISRRSKG